MSHKHLLFMTGLAGACIFSALPVMANENNKVIVGTDAYTWRGDTIIQGEYRAWAPDEHQLVSTYSAQPGYYMPVEKNWKLKNDISSYPRLVTPNKLHAAIYNLGLDEMVNAVEPDTTLRTGKEWAGVWTRDVSYSIILSMAYMQPEASMISLMKKVNKNGRIIQDTGSGGAWPVSSDRMIWAVAAYEIYKVTGDRKWLEYIYPVIKNSLEDDLHVVADKNDGLMHGETSFIDWRHQSYPRWMQMSDIYQSEALNTTIVHALAWRVLADIATELGHKKVAAEAQAQSDKIAQAINNELWLEKKGYYAMYNYGRIFPILNPRAETLGESMAVIYGIAPEDRAKSITENNPTTPFGTAIFFPQIADMPSYHNNALWPWVGSLWAIANAKARNEEGTLEAIGAVFRPAALFTTNKENFRIDNGDIATELNSSNMLWCLAGNIALTHKILFGINFEKDGLAFDPFVPKALAGDRSLKNFKYRNATLDINISGYGDRIKSFRLNGKEHKNLISPDIKGHNTIDIVMADNEIAPMKVNRTANVKAPFTPIVTLTNSPDIKGAPVNNLLQWQPIEYIDHYVIVRDGKRIAVTDETSFDASTPGEYQVIGVMADRTESFASEPVDNFPACFFELPDETTVLKSDEICYPVIGGVSGYHGEGFVEFDHTTAPVTVDIDVPADGEYALAAIYTNGNGPINTENKCAVRTISVDGNAEGVIVMPQRGESKWSDWGQSNVLRLPLKAGRHQITISMSPADENMNLSTNHAVIDRLKLSKIK